MSTNPAHVCVADAYQASADLSARYLAWFDSWRGQGVNTPAGVARWRDAEEILDAANSFAATDYYADC